MLEDVYARDLDAGYHEKGSCVDGDDDTGCVIHDLFGGFNDRAGRVIRRPIRFSPIRRQVDVTKGEAEAHYRQLNTQVRSRNAEDEGQPLRQATRDIVGNLVGTWRLTLRELKPEYVGLLVEAIDYLDTHSAEYDMQLGGARNFGAGIVDAEVVNRCILIRNSVVSTIARRTRRARWTRKTTCGVSSVVRRSYGRCRRGRLPVMVTCRCLAITMCRGVSRRDGLE